MLSHESQENQELTIPYLKSRSPNTDSWVELGICDIWPTILLTFRIFFFNTILENEKSQREMLPLDLKKQ